ncbi:MAG: hypothetical protein Q7S26_00845 [bacterium]|nr:hypothetical protein [bacterium]
MSQQKIANLLLRLSIGFAFLYPPIDALFSPDSWVGYFPPFVYSATQQLGISNLLLLHGFGVVEVVIALWILSGWKIFWPSLTAAALLCAIVIGNPSQFEVLFRDLSLAAAALALACLSYFDTSALPTGKSK